MSEPSCAWISEAFSGVSRCSEPSRCDRKRAPSSVIVRLRREAEHLVAAAVGQDRLVPADESVQAAHARDAIVAGPQIEMVGVAQEDGGAGIDQIAMRHTLHRTLRADRHERRRLDLAVRRDEPASTRASVGVRERETERRHARRVQRREFFDKFIAFVLDIKIFSTIIYIWYEGGQLRPLLVRKKGRKPFNSPTHRRGWKRGSHPFSGAIRNSEWCLGALGADVECACQAAATGSMS